MNFLMMSSIIKIGSRKGSVRKRIQLLFILTLILTGWFSPSVAQVKITDGTETDINPNSLLELESSDKGLLVPRIAINDINLPAPLIAPVPVGMLVFSIGGDVTDGFYYWGGSSWERVFTTGTNIMQTFTRRTSTTLSKNDNIIFAMNNITLTLPQVTSADTGLLITVKNVGAHTDLVKVTGYEGATIDNIDTIRLLPQWGRTFIARGSNWVVQDKSVVSEDVIEVGPFSSFRTLAEALEFLKAHMDRPKVIRIAGQTFYLSETQVIDLPYPVTIQGTSFGTGIIAAGPGLTGKPMFRCITESYFKMLVFDATTLPGYGSSPGEDGIRLVGDGTYHEIKDCTFDGFYNAILDSSDAELWLFECDISNSQNAGILINSSIPGTKLRVSETDFFYCRRGIDLSKGSEAEIQLFSGQYLNEFETDSALIYRPATFSFKSMVITGNTWTHIGTQITGFDFSRPDGRDANAYIEGNTGSEDRKPHCDISVVDNSTSFTCSVANEWYKANWINTSTFTINWLIGNNRITYLPLKSRNVYVIITGNIMVNSNNRIIALSLVKNGNTDVRYGETTLRITTPNQPFQFSTVIYLQDVSNNDYFELFCSSRNPGDVLTFQDINWFVDSI
jgi:hypothetical protein